MKAAPRPPPPPAGVIAPQAIARLCYPLAALILASLIWKGFSHHEVETTDDAYVAGNILPVASQIPGTVTHILADNTAEVSTGELLIELDPTDARMDVSPRPGRAAAGDPYRTRTVCQNRAIRRRYAPEQVESDKARADLGVRQALATSG